jgi:flagellar basal-body rod protein FlgB
MSAVQGTGASNPNQGVDLLLRLLDASELRAKVLSANIANQNTPGYTRSDVKFEDLLRDAARKGPSAEQSVEPEVIPDTNSPARPDGNNVTLELELNAMRENRLMYETYATILEGHFNLMRAAITGGN